MVLNRRGFTFVELLIAATMMSVLFVGLAAHLRGGITLWLRTTKTIESLQRQRVALDRLERDLANAFVYGAARPAWEAETERVSWTTVEPASREHASRVRVVSYECGPRGGVEGFWRISQSVSEARSGAETEPERLLDGCEALTIRYAYQPADPSQPLAWETAWRKAADALPKLVEVTLTRAEGVARRTVEIPPGLLEPG